MGLIKSIKKRIKRYKERRTNYKFKRDLENKMQSFLDSNSVGILESDIGPVRGGGHLVVSLTSYPLRIPTLCYTLFSLLTQDYKPNKIILWLSLKEFSRGEQDLPQEVENVILEIPFIKDCLVYGESSAIVGQSVSVKVVLDAKISLSNLELKKQIRKHCKDKLAYFKIPAKVEIVESLAMSERFKKLRNM